jgi:hypothetical protein
MLRVLDHMQLWRWLWNTMIECTAKCRLLIWQEAKEGRTLSTQISRPRWTALKLINRYSHWKSVLEHWTKIRSIHLLEVVNWRRCSKIHLWAILKLQWSLTYHLPQLVVNTHWTHCGMQTGSKNWRKMLPSLFRKKKNKAGKWCLREISRIQGWWRLTRKLDRKLWLTKDLRVQLSGLMFHSQLQSIKSLKFSRLKAINLSQSREALIQYNDQARRN